MSTNIKQIDNGNNEKNDQLGKLRGPQNIVESQNAYLAASLRSSINGDSSDKKGTGKKITIGLIILAMLFAVGMLFKGMLPNSTAELNDPQTASSVLEVKSEPNESLDFKANMETTQTTETTETTESLLKPAIKTATKETNSTKQPEELRLAANKLVAELALDETSEESKQPDLHETSQEKTQSGSGEVDYYNSQTVQSSSDNGLQSSIDALMNVDAAKKSEYIAKLDKEADVRQNAVRSIALEKGDTLWSLAKRAYGDGMLYHKILAANPQVTEENARKLRIGTLIRVPN